MPNRHCQAWTPAAGRLPVPFNSHDSAALILSGIALAGWFALSVIKAPSAAVAAALVMAGLANLWRQARWAPLRTFAEPLVAILHLAFAFIGIGFLLAGLGV